MEPIDIWVMLAEYLAEMMFCNMSIPLRSADGRMTKKFLNYANVGSVL